MCSEFLKQDCIIDIGNCFLTFVFDSFVTFFTCVDA